MALINSQSAIKRVEQIVRKLDPQNRYQLTVKGMRLINALQVLLDASTENFLQNIA